MEFAFSEPLHNAYNKFNLHKLRTILIRGGGVEVQN